MKKLIRIAALALLVAACSTTPDQKVPVDDRNPLGTTANPGGPGSTTNPTGTGNLSGTPITPTGPGGTTAGSGTAAAGRIPPNVPGSILSKRSVYYDLDSFVIKDEFKPMIEAHGRFLRDNRNAHVIVQGNTDERGGSEYNLALGNKRAESVKRMFSLLGVQEAQIETISFGKEKPRNAGHDESAWNENRRSDLVYQGE
ncbi:MAG: peptidoglycan-associated lipoprotein Pal [Betaproteobacteria bacterium]